MEVLLMEQKELFIEKINGKEEIDLSSAKKLFWKSFFKKYSIYLVTLGFLAVYLILYFVTKNVSYLYLILIFPIVTAILFLGFGFYCLKKKVKYFKNASVPINVTIYTEFILVSNDLIGIEASKYLFNEFERIFYDKQKKFIFFRNVKNKCFSIHKEDLKEETFLFLESKFI